MEKKMTILYKYHGNLYVNLTNRCCCACTFCLRQNMDSVIREDGQSLWLEHEPDFEEVKAAFNAFNMDEFEEVVFCGYGEPTERLDLILQVAAYVKENFKKKTRVNTNGQSDLIWGRDTAPDFKGLIDTVSISLNNPDPEKYQEIVRSKYGVEGFHAMLKFAKNVKQYVSEVVMTTVDTTLTKEEEAKCADICRELGVRYRIRAWES